MPETPRLFVTATVGGAYAGWCSACGPMPYAWADATLAGLDLIGHGAHAHTAVRSPSPDPPT